MNLVSAISILSNCGATWAPVVQHPRAWAPPLQSPSLSLSLYGGPACWQVSSPPAGKAPGTERESFPQLPRDGGQGPPRGTLAIAGSFCVWMIPPSAGASHDFPVS